jgi:hypothetical protein
VLSATFLSSALGISSPSVSWSVLHWFMLACAASTADLHAVVEFLVSLVLADYDNS